jgi:hypothetical protein
MPLTRPSSPTIEIYSPTRNGLVKMMVSPAIMFTSTPCIAKATPAPATLNPAIEVNSSTPRFWSAMIANSPRTKILMILNSNWRIGDSRLYFLSSPSTILPAHRPMKDASNDDCDRNQHLRSKLNGQIDNGAYYMSQCFKLIVHNPPFIELASQANACGRYEWRQIQGLGLGGSENLG